jgi:hypothetical protein
VFSETGGTDVGFTVSGRLWLDAIEFEIGFGTVFNDLL